MDHESAIKKYYIIQQNRHSNTTSQTSTTHTLQM